VRTWLVEGATSVLLFPLAVVARTHDAMATHDPAVQSTILSPLPKRRDRRRAPKTDGDA
jgi:hypothetical protein